MLVALTALLFLFSSCSKNAITGNPQEELKAGLVFNTADMVTKLKTTSSSSAAITIATEIDNVSYTLNDNDTLFLNSGIHTLTTFKLYVNNKLHYINAVSSQDFNLLPNTINKISVKVVLANHDDELGGGTFNPIEDAISAILDGKDKAEISYSGNGAEISAVKELSSTHNIPAIRLDNGTNGAIHFVISEFGVEGNKVEVILKKHRTILIRLKRSGDYEVKYHGKTKRIYI